MHGSVGARARAFSGVAAARWTMRRRQDSYAGSPRGGGGVCGAGDAVLRPGTAPTLSVSKGQGHTPGPGLRFLAGRKVKRDWEQVELA